MPVVGKAVFDPRHTEEKVPPSVSRFTAAELKEQRLLSQIHDHLWAGTTNKGKRVGMSARAVKGCMGKFGELWQQLTTAREDREPKTKKVREGAYRATMGHRRAQDGLKEEKRELEAVTKPGLNV